jgi:hypothetical protein
MFSIAPGRRPDNPVGASPLVGDEATIDTAAGMDIEHLLPGIIGAFVGVIGWLGVGLFIQRRQFSRQARTAARAVYFELDVNRVAVEVALAHGSFAPLARTAFDRLLPELAMLLSADELRVVVRAYMAHAGYQQAETNEDLPPAVRRQALVGIVQTHSEALELLGGRAFSAREARALAASTEPTPVPASDVSSVQPERR